MNRRDLLAGLAAGVAGTVGCLSAPRAGWASDRGGGDPVPRSDLVRAAPLDGIPAIDDPAFGDGWDGTTVTAHDPRAGTYETEVTLSPGDRVIGVARGDGTRAYPLKLLNYHEVVNDRTSPWHPRRLRPAGRRPDRPIRPWRHRPPPRGGIPVVDPDRAGRRRLLGPAPGVVQASTRP